MRAIVAESPEQLTWQEVPGRVTPSPGEVLLKVSRGRRQPRRPAAGRRTISATAGSQRDHRHGGLRRRSPRWAPMSPEWTVGQAGLRLAGRRRLRRVRGRSGRPADADSLRRRHGRRGRVARGGLHGVVEPGDDAHLSDGQVVLHARRSQRHRKPRDPGGSRVGRSRCRHRGSAEKLEFCRDLGAQIAINYRDEDFVDAAARGDRRAAPT